MDRGPGRGLAAWEKPGRMTEQNAFTGQGAGLGVLPTSQSPFLISIMFFIICKARLELFESPANLETKSLLKMNNISKQPSFMKYDNTRSIIAVNEWRKCFR